jgi:hypothetical protein
MTVFDVSLYEPIDAVVTADSSTPTVDSLTPTADGGILVGATEQVYAAINANVLFADIYEPVAAVITADTTAYTADNATWPTADGGTLEGARDFTDAEVIAAELPGEGGAGIVRPLRPHPIVGIGYGILPELEGEAFGAVVVAGSGIAKLSGLIGAATGSVGVTGRSAGVIDIRAAAVGKHGQAGAGDAVLKAISVASDGVVGIRGSGLGMIVKLKAAATGRHDDDDAVVMTFLLAA